MKLAIASDHAAFDCKQMLLAFLGELGHEVMDFGCFDTSSVDYPDYAEKVAGAVISGQAQRGILLCATGVGMSIAANKIDGIRCALCADPVTARLTREHNDTNVLALGALVCGREVVKAIVSTWLGTAFSGQERHQNRIDKISLIEKHR
jgi:ribose 5-phosphate isomerase B